MLLIPASLFTKSFFLAKAASPGFRVENVLTLTASPPLGGDSAEQTKLFYTEAQRRVAGMPGVISAALATHLVMGDNSYYDLVAPENREAVGVLYNQVTPEYFGTMAVPIVQGRPFEDRDSAGSPQVAI